MTTFQILTSSESNEYYTPARYTDAARLVMGGIDIDPASCEIAQGWIKAAICYDQTEDGFQKDWHGRLWLNPPYGQASLAKNNYGAGAWCIKAGYQYRKGNVTQACILARGDSFGVKQLMRECIYCECDRIAFLTSVGETNNPVPGTRIFYLGDRVQQFKDVFSQFGIIVKAV